MIMKGYYINIFLDKFFFEGKFDDAILDMKQALRLDPGFEPAQTGLLCAQKDRENKLKRGW